MNIVGHQHMRKRQARDEHDTRRKELVDITHIK